jgi:beta-N-acetylhexosaminidase
MIDYNLNNLSLEEKIGQLIIFGFDALEINDHALKLIRDFKAGNVILFSRNVKDPKQLFELNKSLQKLALTHLKVPLFISIDQEGGMVTRITNKATYFPGAMTLAATDKPENAYISGKIMGQELKALGVNMNLAPSLDINNNPKNPVIGVRSFGDTPKRVSEFGIENIRGLQENVVATAKHFPGHGDTFVDSHLGLPQINKTLQDLEEFELIPFKKAIDNGVKAIMSAHINFPAITEENLPATLSYACLTELLRKKLGFIGLIITDCMQMKAIQKDYTTKKGVLMAIEAGANLVCISHSEVLQTEAIEYVKQAVIEGRLPIEVIDDRVKRVLEFKKNNIEVNLNKSYEEVLEIVINEKSKAISYQLTKDAFTLYKGGNIDYSKKSLVIASEPISTTIADESDGVISIIKAIEQENINYDTYKIAVDVKYSEVEELKRIVKDYQQVIFCSYNSNIYESQLHLIEELNKIENFFVIAMRNPYDSLFIKDLKNLMLLYEYTPNSVRVLIEYLKGNLAPRGKAPVKL